MLFRTLEELNAWFARTPAGKEIIAERKNEQIATRRETAAALAKIEAEAEAKTPALIAAKEKAVSRVRKAKTDLDDAQRAYGQAQREAMSHSLHVNNTRQRLRDELMQSAPPQIRQAAEQLRDLVEMIRGQGNAVFTKEYANNWMLGVDQLTASNVDAVERRFALIFAAMEQLSELAWSGREDVADEIAKILTTCGNVYSPVVAPEPMKKRAA